jgi:hypothetical protein
MRPPNPVVIPPRRAFLADLGLGFTGLALGAMLARDGVGSPADWTPPDGRPHFAPKAKSVIWLFMNGGVSHLESFDYKPEITKHAGKTIAETPYADVQNPAKLALERAPVPDANGLQRNVLFPLQTGFRRHGQSGLEISDLFPHTARNADRIAVVVADPHVAVQRLDRVAIEPPDVLAGLERHVDRGWVAHRITRTLLPSGRGVCSALTIAASRVPNK